MSKKFKSNKKGRIQASEIGLVSPKDFNNRPGKLNDLEDIEISKLQYESPVITQMKKDLVYDSLCNLVRAMKISDKSDSFIVERIKIKFSSYCGSLTIPTFKKWLEYYVELRDAYYSGREEALGELVVLGLERARRSVNSEKPDDFIVKLMDRLDDGTLNAKNSKEVLIKQSNSSDEGITKESLKTIGKVMKALGDIEEPEAPDESYLMEEGGIVDTE